MSPLHALLGELTAECDRLLERVSALSEENRRLSTHLGEQLLAPSDEASPPSRRLDEQLGAAGAEATRERSRCRICLEAQPASGSQAGDFDDGAGGSVVLEAEQNAFSKTLLNEKSSAALQKGRSSMSMELWPLWSDEEDAEGGPPAALKSTNLASEKASSLQSMDNVHQHQPQALQGEKVVDDSCLQGLVCGPTNRRRLAWDLLSVACLSYDLLLLPLAAFGDIETQIGLWTLNIFTTCFWALDMIASCLTGYYVKGRLEMRPWKITKTYVKHWFFLDAILIAVDIILLIHVRAQLSSISFLRFGKVTRFARILRMIRLVRVFKVIFILNKQSELMKSDMARTFLKIVQLILAIVLANHFIACGWYAIGKWDVISAESPTWVKTLRQKDEEFGEPPLVYFYTTALHWSFTQFTPASMEVVPRNAAERSYNIAVLLMGLVMFSSLVSSITNAMTKLRERNAAREWQREQLSEFFHNQRISLSLGNHIYSFLNVQGYTVETRVLETDIPLLKKLPEKMRKRLHGEVYRPSLKMHPFFYKLDKNDGATTLSICHWAMSQSVILEGARLFHFGEPCASVYFVNHGEMEYFLGANEMATALVRHRDHVSEGALWARWEHRGRAEAENVTELCVLDTMSFRGVVRQTRLLPFCRAYAQNFCRRMTEYGLTDIALGIDELQDLSEQAFELQREDILEDMDDYCVQTSSTGDSGSMSPSVMVTSVLRRGRTFARQKMGVMSWGMPPTRTLSRTVSRRAPVP